MTNRLSISVRITYDAIWVELWQPWRGGASGLHDVSKDVYILAVAFYQ